MVPILSDVNLSRKLVGDGKRGRVFRTKEELIACIASLIEDPSEIREIVKNGREYARQVTLEVWADSIVEKLSMSIEPIRR